MSDTSDATVIRTAGIVLCSIGSLALVAILGWNQLVQYPAVDSLEPVSGTVVVGRVKVVQTRTSIERWVVVEVVTDSESGSSDTSECWVFPSYAGLLADEVETLKAGERVSGLALREAQRLRWSEGPVRVIWSLARNGRELVTRAEVIAIEEAARRQPPRVGFLMIGLGMALILGSRLRVGTSASSSSR